MSDLAESDLDHAESARLVARAVRVAEERGETLLERGSARLGDRMAERLDRGLDALTSLDSASIDEFVGQVQDGTADPDLEWALNVVLQVMDLDDPAVDALLRSQQRSRVLRRRSAPLPTERWRRAQRDRLVTPTQAACLQRLTQRARSFDSLLADSYRQLLDDCYELVTTEAQHSTLELVDVMDHLDHGVTVLDDRLRRFVEGEWLRARSDEATGARGPRVVVLAGPPSIGKRRFGRAAAAALGRSYHQIRCGSLDRVRHELLGEWSPPDDAIRGVFVEAALATEGATPVIFLDGIDEMAPTDAALLASTLVDLTEHPARTMRGRYLPEEFPIDLGPFVIIVSSKDPASVPPALADHVEVIDLGPPSPAQREDISRRFIVPELCQRHSLEEPATVISDATVSSLVDRHDARAGMRELARDLERVLAAWLATDRSAPVSVAELDTIVGGAPGLPGTLPPGSVWVPLLRDGSGVVARLDVTATPGYSGTLLPEFVHPRTAALISDAIDTIRIDRPLGIPVPLGVRVTLNLQSAEAAVHAPWLSTFAALAACSLASGHVLDVRHGVLAVLTGRGVLEPLELPSPLVATLANAMEWDRAVTPGHDQDDAGTDSSPSDLTALLSWFGFRPLQTDQPGMYL